MRRFLITCTNFMIRAVEAPARAVLDGAFGFPEPTPARQARAAGTRLAGCFLIVVGIRGILTNHASDPTVLSILNGVELLLFCGAVQQHSWASGYTRRDRFRPLNTLGQSRPGRNGDRR